jgi:sensor histidine kinase YesM
MLINLVLFILGFKKISGSRRKAISLYILIPTLSMIIQMFSYGIFTIALGSVVSSLVMLLLIIKEDSAVFTNQQAALIEQDYRTRTLQMRPHFIYNTLSNIYYLCEIDPMKAQKAIDDFSTYLKSNFGAVSKENLIPFEEELNHTKAYVAVVKARYEEYLFVDFDTPFTAFKLPPLTLEPLVENAVKHALDPNQGPLYVLVRTRRENSYNIIIVENSGKDFSLEDETEASSLAMNDEPHIGLSNVKRRLEISCGGSLKVSKRPDGGTIATIRIPSDLSGFK